MRQLSIAVFSSVCLILLSSLLNQVHAAGKPMDMKKLTQTISDVITGTTSTIRTQAAQHLVDLTTGAEACEISDASVNELISLLDSSEDSVRYWIARSLGNLGGRASVAIPKLQGLLREADCLQGDKTAASGIRLALTQIGATPPPPACD